MTRVKRGVISLKRRRKILKYTKGFRFGAKSKERLAKERLLHAWSHAFRDRRTKKREFRKLWQLKINAGLKPFEISYSKFINRLKKNSIKLDRKILSQIAEFHPKIFQEIVKSIQ
ncbi:MAG: 50S ribosomal protein L20 [Candidatus Niyogibacteria bacterium RIFCSPLOWO2_12_FULL_41_13]|uniref:Large ribosomal subunit protein bL20 n=1 Tax=Candidatus Niyogibacteria bacterium RIFCSPLOWO2_12_FULL_41_13 TaxID=1801726 RepID=A0A1G2F3R6_9BACT|nr:MAG: 50S ribosomal protein L20 [Candidatus Niyogibacteria bacterium RIFCSPLOWO2_12_FULL_41_13]